MNVQQMDVTVVRPAADRGVRVVVSGEIDIATAGRLHAALDTVLGGRPADVEVDLTAVTFFSCAAAHLLWSARQRTTGSLTLVGAGRPVRRLLETMQLQPLLEPVTNAG